MPPFQTQLPAPVAAQADFLANGFAATSATVFDGESDDLRQRLQCNDPKDGFPFHAEKSVEGQMRMSGIPEPAAWGEVRNLRQGEKDLSHEGFAVLAFEFSGGAAAEHLFHERHKRVRAILLHFDDEFAGMHRHGFTKLFPSHPPGVEEVNQLPGVGGWIRSHGVLEGFYSQFLDPEQFTIGRDLFGPKQELIGAWLGDGELADDEALEVIGAAGLY